MKKICLLTFSVFINVLTFAQNKDIIGFWKLEKFDVDAKTNYPLLSKATKEQFGGNVTDDDGNAIILDFKEHGYIYIDGKVLKRYTIKKDSIFIGGIDGIFTIKDNILDIRCDKTDYVTKYAEYLSPTHLKKYEIRDDKPIKVERVFIHLQLQRYDSIVPDNKFVISVVDIDYVTAKNILVEPKPEHLPFTIVEQMPAFKGGEEAMMKFINDNIQYPESAKQEGLQGRIITRFVVQIDGKLTNVEVLKAKNTALEQEAIRLIKLMPDWIPGKQNDRIVPVYYSIPISFKLPVVDTRKEK